MNQAQLNAMPANEYSDLFDVRFANFMTLIQAFMDDHQKRNEYRHGTLMSFTRGRRYIRVIRSNMDGGSKSVYCFIDTSGGDVLKPEGWNAPAKHARGSIFADDNGMGCCGPWGVAYLR